MLAVRDAALAAPCYVNELVGDSLVRVSYVAVVERGIADRAAWGKLGPIASRLQAIEIPLADLEALYAKEGGAKLPALEPECAAPSDCYPKRFAALLRGAAGDADTFWANLTPESMGAYRLLERPSLATLLFRLEGTNQRRATNLAPLAGYARSLPPGVGALPRPAAPALGSFYDEVRSGAVSFERGFDFSPSALVQARATAMRFVLAAPRPAIYQFEPAPLVLRVTNPGGLVAIVRPTTSPTSLGEGSPYPVAVRVRRPGGGDGEGVQLAPPDRFDERERRGPWLLAVPPGELAVLLAVSADRQRAGEPLFATTGVYRLSAEIRPVPDGESMARLLAAWSLPIEGTVEITVRPLELDDRSCWDRIAPGSLKWVLYDPEGTYIAATPTPDLKVAQSWIESVRPACGASLFRSYLELAHLGIARELADRRGNWSPTPADLALLETLSNSPAFSYQREAALLLGEARSHVARP